MSDVEERFMRWRTRLPPDAPFDYEARALALRALADREALAEYLLKHECAPSLLGEFIFQHWSSAVNDAPESAARRLTDRVMQALERIEDNFDRHAASRRFQIGLVPSARTLRLICKEINDAR